MSDILRNKFWKQMNPSFGNARTSLVVHWLRLFSSTAGGKDSIPGWGTKIPHGTWSSHKIKNENVIISR